MPHLRKPALRSLEERNQLVLDNYRLPHYVIKRLLHSRPYNLRHLGLEDAAQIGYVALLRAADLWNPERGITFSTYACRAIFSAIVDCGGDTGAVPVKKCAWRKGIHPPGTRPLPPPEVIEVPNAFLYEDPDWTQQEDLEQARKLLPARWRKVLTLRYEQGFCYRTIGRKIKLSYETVRQTEKRALAWLRAYLEGETRLRPKVWERRQLAKNNL